MEYKQNIQIETAEKGEATGIKTIYSYPEFRNEVKYLNQIDDIFDDPRIKIRKDQSKYLFNINGINKFSVDTGKLEEWLNMFYDEKKEKEEREAEEEVYVRVEGLEISYIKSETEEELEDLQYNIKKTSTRIEHSTDMESTKYKVETYIAFFEQELKLTKQSASQFRGVQYDRKDRGLWNINKVEINRRIKQLKKIKQQIEWLEKNKGKRYTINRKDSDGDVEVKEVNMTDLNAFDEKMTLSRLNERIDELGKEAPDFIRARNENIVENADTTPYYEITLNNVKDAAKLKIIIKKINDDYMILNRMSLSVDKRQALQQDLIRLQEYLENYANNPNMPLAPFVPESGDAFEELCKIDPSIKKYTKLNKRAGKPSKGEAKPSYDGNNSEEKNNEKTDEYAPQNTNNSNRNREYIPSGANSAGDAFEKGGVSGLVKYGIDKTNMRPEQKQFRGGVGNLAVVGGAVFLGVKMIGSAFRLLFKSGKGSKAEKTGIYDSSNRAWLGIPAALVFGSQAWTGQGAGGLLTGGPLTESLMNIFGGSKNTSQESLIYAQGFPGATAMFSGLEYGDMKQVLIKENGRMKINPAQYDATLEIFKTGRKKNPTAVAFLESIGKNDDKNIIDLALTGMGITREQLQDDSNKKKKFDKAASDAIAKLGSISEYMERKKYNKINPETLPLIRKYISDGKNIDELQDLDERGDVFYKEMIVTDKTGLKDRITELAQGNIQKEQDLLLAINTFYDYFPTADKKIELIGTGPEIEFKTYNKTTKINIENKNLVGFTPKAFDSYAELFKTANLTNNIKKICEDKETNTPTPFHISYPGKDIEFAADSMFKIDTEILSAGSGDALKKISPILEEYKDIYCEYLNTLKFRKQ